MYCFVAIYLYLYVLQRFSFINIYFEYTFLTLVMQCTENNPEILFRGYPFNLSSESK